MFIFTIDNLLKIESKHIKNTIISSIRSTKHTNKQQQQPRNVLKPATTIKTMGCPLGKHLWFNMWDEIRFWLFD